jgi:hypothetical protein
MWYSTITDMDFCLVHGKSHDNRDIYLIPYNGVINGKEVKNGYFTGKKATIRKNLTVEPVDKKQLILLRLNQVELWSKF